MILKMNVELGLATNEIACAKISNLQQHSLDNYRFYTLKLDEGCKKVIINKKTRKTKARDRIVVCNSRLSDELFYFVRDKKHEGKEYIIQPERHAHDGVEKHYIECLYRKHNIPFTPHATIKGIMGGRHLHKYLIESVCVRKQCYSERQVEMHLGHKIHTDYTNYGAVLNIELMSHMVEETFVRV